MFKLFGDFMPEVDRFDGTTGREEVEKGLPIGGNDDEEDEEEMAGDSVSGEDGNDSGKEGGGGIDGQVEGEQSPKVCLPCPTSTAPRALSPLLSISHSRQSSWFIESDQHNQPSHHHSLSIPITFGAKN